MKSFTPVLCGILLMTACNCNEDKKKEEGTLQVNFETLYNGEPLALGESYDWPAGGKVRFLNVQMFVSGFKVENGSKSTELQAGNTDNIRIIDLYENKGGELYTQKLDAGTYSNFSFNVGLAPDINSSNLADYEDGHPLRTPGMHWNWNTLFRFLVVEGRYDKDNDGIFEQSLSFHIGLDQFFKAVSLPTSLAISDGETTTTTITLDTYKFLQPFDFETQYATHSETQEHLLINQMVIDNYKNCFGLK